VLPIASAFTLPSWTAPLDAERAILAMPESATIAGLFYVALRDGAERRQLELTFPRPRYLPFSFYPVREFARLLVEAAPKFHRGTPLRQALRLLGRAGPKALLSSTLGKVTLGAAEGVHAAVTSVAKTYATYVRPSRCEVRQLLPRSMVVTLDDVPHFLDCHHIGVFEGCLEYAGAKGEVRIFARGAHSADLWLSW
jgi:uncharacterized protein (TIGR02265 family)